MPMSQSLRKFMICCLVSWLQTDRIGTLLSIGSFVSSASLMFESEPRRVEIALFTFVRSFKGYYTYLYRRRLINVPYIDKLCFVGVFAALSVIFHEFPDMLKHKFVLDKLWGPA